MKGEIQMSEVQEHEFPYPYPYYNEKNGRVICQICGKDYQVISPTHLKKHNLKLEEYRLRFPDAPVSSEEFKIKGLQGKHGDLFKPKEDPQIEEPIGEEVLITEEEIAELEAEEEKIDVSELKADVIKSEPPKDPIAAMKRRVFNHLCTFFSNVRQDYMVEEKTIGGTVKYSYITDFCDPVLRIIIDCPNTFWHNIDTFEDPLKKEKLRQDGWRIYTIKSRSPQLKDIEELFKKM